jgi:hypothetical protein
MRGSASDEAARRQALLIESALTALIDELDCASVVEVSSGPVTDSDGDIQGISIDLAPTIEGPAPMSVMTDGGSILYFSFGRMGVSEFVDDSPADSLASLVSTVRMIMEFGLVEDIQVGILRVSVRMSAVLPTGTERYGYASSWRSPGEQSRVLTYVPYVGT